MDYKFSEWLAAKEAVAHHFLWNQDEDIPVNKAEKDYLGLPQMQRPGFRKQDNEQQVDEGLFKKKLSTFGGSVGPVTRRDRVKQKWAEIEKKGKEEDAANKKSLEKPFRRRYQNAK